MAKLWLVDLNAAAPALAAVERETPRLSREDRERAMALHNARERQHRLAAYTALRVALESMAGVRTRQRAFRRSAAGRPYLTGIAAPFSLSHTDGLALIGVAPLRRIGVDIEKARSACTSQARRQQIMAAGAGLAGLTLRSSRGDRRNHGFLQAWTRLEAYAKAQGQAILRVLHDLGVRNPAHGVPLDAIREAAQRAAAARRLRVLDLALPRGLLGAVAIDVGCPPPRLRRFPCDVAGIRRLTSQPAKRDAPPPEPLKRRTLTGPPS